MKRRRVLAVAGAASVGALSGCAGVADLLDDSEDGESYTPTPVDVDGSETPEPTETPDSDDEGITFSQPDSGESGSGSSGSNDRGSNGPEVETPENLQERERIFELYNDGIGQLNDGVRSREAAVGAFNNDQYGRCEREARASHQAFDRAEDTFADARDTAREIGNRDAADICQDAAEHATLMKNAMQELESVADLARDGHTDRANERLDRVRELETEAERLNPPDGDVILSVLDLE